MNSNNARPVAIIGGGSGLGLAIAREFLNKGNEVIIGSRSEKKLDESVVSLGKGAQRSIIDVNNQPSVVAFFENVGRIQHLVITASTGIADKPIIEMNIEEVKAFAETKLWGAIRVIQAALRTGIADSGSITLISGAVARKGRSGAHAKTIVNSALEGLTRSLAIELRGQVRVNCISPAVFDSKGTMPLAKQAELKQLYPTGYVGTGYDVAMMACAMATNPFMTGTVLYIDGGWTAE
jgi:NAD(P)-dependent dehydrogenase (short-subunit alcohol dehydrogenase family)